jgi:serine/threonine protein kinase
MDERDTWGFDEGAPIAPGVHAVRLLGGGNRYEAYLAWHDALHALVVAKVLRPAVAHAAPARAAIAREVAALADLAHPAIVRSFDAALDGEPPMIVLEFLDGPRLSTLVRRYDVNIEQALFLALELCSALHYIGTRGYVHLDVKPRNIIMASSPRLIDLSVATRTDDLGRITSPIGTDAYMAPEQCAPDRFADIESRTDVWGLGATLYETITRRPPFPVPHPAASSPTERYPQLHLAPEPLPAKVPLALAQLLHACLEKRPADRPTAADVAATVEPWADTVPRPRLGVFRPGGRPRGSLRIA